MIIYTVLLNHNYLYSVILYEKLNGEVLIYFVKGGNNSDFSSLTKHNKHIFITKP